MTNTIPITKKSNLLSIKILASLAIFLSIGLIMANRLDPDLGWHIRSGQWILQHWAIQHFDEFSFSMAGYRWVNHEWFLDIVFYLAQTYHYWWPIVIIFTVLTATPPIYYILRSQNKLDLALILGLAFALTPFLGIRPQIISWFIFFLLAGLLNNLSQKKTFDRLDSLKIIGLFWLWSNLHASFPAGLLLYLIFIITNYFRPTNQNFPLGHHIITFIISITVTFINPYFFELYQEIYKVALSSSTTQYIAEWQSALVFFSPEIWLIIAIGLLFIVGWYKKISLSRLISTIVFLLAFIKSVRFGPFFFIIFYPLIIEVTPPIIKKIHHSLSQNITLKSQLFLIISALLLIMLTNFASKIIFIKPVSTPDKAIQFLTENFAPHQLKIFNAYLWGGYLINHYPENKVFIDGRMPHWTDSNGNSAMKDYIKINTQSLAWEKIFPKYQINTVFIKNTSRRLPTDRFSKLIYSIIAAHPSLNRFLKRYVEPPSIDLKTELTDHHWHVIYQDNLVVILQNNPPNPAPTIF